MSYKKGTKVTYIPKYGTPEKGIIQRSSNGSGTVGVVYNCNNDWENYEDYTSVSTQEEQLKFGW